MLRFLNPLYWLNGAVSFLGWIFGSILRFFGMMPAPSTQGFENIQTADVDDAAKLAAEQEAAVHELVKQMSPAEVVRAYARADAAGRAEMDLSALRYDEQDWLLGLSDEDLDKLSMSTTNGCARSLERKEVLPIYTKAASETETPEVYEIPSEEEIEEMKREFVSARFRELFYAPGVPNTNPRFSETRH